MLISCKLLSLDGEPILLAACIHMLTVNDFVVFFGLC